MSIFDRQFAKRKEQILNSSTYIQFLPDGPCIKGIVVKAEHTGEPQPDDHLWFGIITMTDCDLLKYHGITTSDGRGFVISRWGIQNVGPLNLTSVTLL